MLKDEHDYKTIYVYVHYKRYDGGDSALDHHIYSISKNNFSECYPKAMKFIKKIYPKDVIIITRSQLLKYILTVNSKTKKDNKIKENIELIKQKYPLVTAVKQVFNDFHSVIMSDTPELIDQFIDIYEDTELSDFCYSIKKDIASVKNAISYNISSGFVEDNNNKFKLIKRIVYRKSKLVNLFKNVMLHFRQQKKNLHYLNCYKNRNKSCIYNCFIPKLSEKS